MAVICTLTKDYGDGGSEVECLGSNEGIELLGTAGKGLAAAAASFEVV